MGRAGFRLELRRRSQGDSDAPEIERMEEVAGPSAREGLPADSLALAAKLDIVRRRPGPEGGG
jgi:hypothetical protein